MKTIQRRKFRKIWQSVHRWLGLIAGLHFVLLGLTGSALVFFKEIDRWLEPARYAPLERAARVSSLNAMALQSEAELGSRTHLIYFLPGRSERTVEFWAETNSANPETRPVCNFDRATGERLGCWVWGQTLTTWIYRLHYELLLGSIGTKIVGATGFLVLILILTGLYLWWPTSRLQWKSAFRITNLKNRFRLNYDLHRLFGLYSSFALLAIAFSGIALSYPDFIRSSIGLVADLSVRPAPKISELSRKPAFDQTRAVVQKVYPDSEFVYIEAPDQADTPYQVGIKTAEDGDVKGILTELWIDPQKLQIVERREFKSLNSADKFLVIQFPLHNGDLFGLLGRWIVFVLGVLPAILLATGAIIYLKKSRFLKTKSV